MFLLRPIHVLRRGFARLRGSFRRAPDWRSAGPYQVAALPVKVTAKGTLKVLLISTRSRHRKLIIPRGWPMKGKADFQAAAIEAEEEAGVLGPVSLDPVGTYHYSSARNAGNAPIRVDVYRLNVTRSTPRFKEKRERRLAWLSVEDAARQVDEPGLVPIIEGLLPSSASGRNQDPST